MGTKIKELFHDNWHGYGILPDINELPLYHRVWVWPAIIIQTPFAMLWFLITLK